MNAAQLQTLRNELTITPRKLGDYDDDVPRPIKMFQETETEFGVPREYFFRASTKAHDITWDVSQGQPMVLETKLQMTGARAEQAIAVEAMLAYFRSGELGAILKADPGVGKCLGLGTPVLRYDGSIVHVEQIREGDLLMGPDSRPRRVQGVTRGMGELYRVMPVKGDPWVCNDVHVLTLVDSGKRRGGVVRDIGLQEYLKMKPSPRERLKQFQPESGVDFPDCGDLRSRPVDPYFLGVWYGDGKKDLTGVTVSKPDPEIRLLCAEVASRYGLRMRVDDEDRCPSYHLVGARGEPNPLLNQIRVLYGDGLQLPRSYLTASRAVRQEFLAGLLDTDGHLQNGGYEIVQKVRGHAEGVAFIARSLGLKVPPLTPKVVDGETYWRVFISGDCSALPLRIPRKKALPRQQIKVATRTGISVEPIGVGEYAGFTLDGDGRFLLGDFTVTHNTAMGLEVARRLGRTTLVVVHKEFLLNQWEARIAKFLPGAKVGRIQGKKCDFKGKDIVLAMVHSLALDSGEKYPQELYDYFGTILVDELHRISAFTWSGVPAKFKAKYRIGLTATPRRKDGTEKVFFWGIGPIAYEALAKMPTPRVKQIEYPLELPKWMLGRQVNDGQLFTVLAEDAGRNRRIVEELLLIVNGKNRRKVLVISERLEHLRQIKDDLTRACTAQGKTVTMSMYVGQWFTGETVEKVVPPTPAQEAEDAVRAAKGLTPRKPKTVKIEKKKTVSREELAAAESAQVLFATKALVEEGFDVPAIDTVILTMPMSDVEQVVGRAQRFCLPEQKNHGPSPYRLFVELVPWQLHVIEGVRSSWNTQQLVTDPPFTVTFRAPSISTSWCSLSRSIATSYCRR